MTDKARELLERALENWDHPVTGNFKRIFEDIRAYLAEPEVKREPLSDDEIDKEWQTLPDNVRFGSFETGIRFAEKHHGIGGEG